MAKRRSSGTGSLYRRTPDGNWRGTFYDHNGKRRDWSTGTTDRRAAERILSKWASDAALRSEGVVDASAEQLAAEGRRAIADHLADWRASVEAKGNTPKRVNMVTQRAERIVAGCRFQTLGEVNGQAVRRFIRARQDEDMATSTINAYLQAIKQFTRWAVGDGRLASDPLAGLSRVRMIGETRQRRPLNPDELDRLITTTEQGPTYRRMSGFDRAMLYRLATGTGFRAGELRHLTAGCFDLDANPPAVTVKAAYSKRRRDDRQPIRADLAERLRAWLAGTPRDAAVFPMMPEKAAAMIRFDLRRARILWRREARTWQERHRRRDSDFLRWCDGDGRVVDFHALRATYITAIVKGGASVKVAQELARHGDPKLTMNTYTRLGVHDLTGALDALPGDDIRTEPTTEAPAMLATGTEDVQAVGELTVDERRNNARSDERGKPLESSDEPRAERATVGATTAARNAATACDGMRTGNAAGDEADAPKPLYFPGESDAVRNDASERGSGPGRIRTCDLPIMSRRL